MENPYVRVSEISQYLICPRQVYYTSKGHEPQIDIDRFLDNLLWKEITRNIFEIPSADIEAQDELNKRIDEIMENVLLIYKNELKNVSSDKINVIKTEFISNVDLNLIKRLKSSKISPYEVDCELNYAKIGLVGCLDSLVKNEEEFYPYLVKTGNSPDFGVWKSDRLCLTAYAILIEESFDTIVKKGLIEYTRIGEVREVQLRSYDRRKVLALINKIRKIKRGALPERVGRKACDSCVFKEMCKVERSLLSKFF